LFNKFSSTMVEQRSVAYPEDEWFEVSHIIDLDGDAMTVSVNGVAAPAGPYAGTTGNLSSMDFFSIDASNRYYIDDFTLGTAFIDVIGEACTLTGLETLCDNFESYAVNSTTGPNADWWTTWSGTEGGAEDGIVSADQAASGLKSMLIAEGGTQDVVLLLGDQNAGEWTLNFQMYVPAGATGYYNFQGQPEIGTDFVQQVFLNNGGMAPGTFEVENVGTATYPEDEWFTVSHIVDLDADEMEVLVNGVSVGVGPYAGTTGNLSSMDFFSIDASNRYYIDDVLLIAPPVGLNELTVSDLSIFPNPNNGQFTIVNDAVAGLYTVRVTDLAGRVIMNDAMTLSEGQSRAITLENANTGMYLVQLIDEDNATLRIVKMMVE